MTGDVLDCTWVAYANKGERVSDSYHDTTLPIESLKMYFPTRHFFSKKSLYNVLFENAVIQCLFPPI